MPLRFLTELSRMLHVVLWEAAALKDLLKSPCDCTVNGRCKGNVVDLSSICCLPISRFDFTLPPEKEAVECPSVGLLKATEERKEEEEEKEEEESDKQIETDGNVTSDWVGMGAFERVFLQSSAVGG